jgi:hypothetical protein
MQKVVVFASLSIVLHHYVVAGVAGAGVEVEKGKEMSETNIEVGNKNG